MEELRGETLLWDGLEDIDFRHNKDHSELEG